MFFCFPSLRDHCFLASALVSLADGVHWFSGAAISFARGLNDTPKPVAVLVVAAAASIKLNHSFLALLIAIGGALGAVRVAHTLGKKITPMAAPDCQSGSSCARDACFAFSRSQYLPRMLPPVVFSALACSAGMRPIGARMD